MYVSSTNEKHYDQVLAVAAAGKHCLAEKPLALSVADAAAMVAACDAAGVVIATKGMPLGIEFAGGTSIIAQFDQPGTQVILYPPAFKSGNLMQPFPLGG